MTTPRRKISILGSTGSIGRQALDVVSCHPDAFDVVGLAAHSNATLLAAQAREFRPTMVALAEETAVIELREAGITAEIHTGMEGLLRLAETPADVVLCAMVGAAGLQPVLHAVESGNRVAVANKEPFVMAGRLIMDRAAARGVDVLPVDSEHNAIFQCLQGHDRRDVRCIHLTASGGPFYGRSPETLRDITPEQAARHPRWEMGAKISIDSATLMNKGLEIVEAMWLFGLRPEQIQVIIHPQSIVHSLVEFNDGHILAHLGVTNMRFPIQFALSYPERLESPMGRLDLAAMGALTFALPDFKAFPCLKLARDAAHTGGTAPAILNAANEEAVAAFCRRELGFLDISTVVGDALAHCPSEPDRDLETVIAADRRARTRAAACIQQMEHPSPCL